MNQDNAEVAKPETLKPWAVWGTQGWGYLCVYVTSEWVLILSGFPTGRQTPASLHKQTAEFHLKTPDEEKTITKRKQKLPLGPKIEARGML